MTRRLVTFGIALAALLGSLTALVGTVRDRDFNLRGYVDATRDANLPFWMPRLGVNADLTQYASAEVAEHLQSMDSMGVNWVRQFFYWDQLQPEPDRFDWAAYDDIIDALTAYPHIQPVAVLHHTPRWARPAEATDDPTAPPADPAVFGQFCGALAARYGHSIHYYQIWDQPNLREAWGMLNPRPMHYLAMLGACYEAIHNADADATVIMAALAPTVETGPQNISDIRYLQQLYASGLNDHTDAFAAKPYGFDLPPDDRTVDESILNFARIIAIREVMVQHGDGHKPLWASAWGWNSLPIDWAGRPSLWRVVSDTQQIEYTLGALDRAEREWPWLGPMILHHWQPSAAIDDPLWGYALLDPNGDPTSLWHALATREVPTAAGDGLYHAVNPFARYNGVWTFGPLGADIGWIDDSQFAFTFAGRDIALLLRQDDYVAYLYPRIGDLPANALPRDAAGNPYIILTSPDRSPQRNLIAVARGLPPRTHELTVITDELIPDEPGSRWAIAGYAVSSGDLSRPYNDQIGIAAVSGLTALLAVIATGYNLPWQRLLQPLNRLLIGLSTAHQLILSALTSLALLISLFITWGDSTPHLLRREPVQIALSILTAGLIYLEPGFVITIILLFLLFILIYNRIELGLMLVIFWSPFFLFPVELYRYFFPLAELILLVTGCAWGLKWVVQGRSGAGDILHLRRVHALDWCVAAWVVIGVISLTWAELRGPALTELRVMILEPALFYLILRTLPIERRALLRLVDTLIIAGVMISLIGLALFVQGQAVITAEAGALRLASVYGSPNNVGLFLGRCIPFALAFVLSPVSPVRRLGSGAELLLMLIAAALTQSAGALFVGIPAAITLVIILSLRRRALLPLAGMIAVGGAAFAFALQSARFARLLSFTEGTNFARIRVWQSAINVISERPLTGLGLDQFLYAFRGRYILPDAWQEPDLSHPHNFILDAWVRLGIFGVIVFVWLQMAFWRSALRAYNRFRIHDPLLTALVIGAMGSMANLLTHGAIDNSIFVHDLAYVFVLLLGVIAIVSNMRTIDAEERLMV